MHYHQTMVDALHQKIIAAVRVFEHHNQQWSQLGSCIKPTKYRTDGFGAHISLSELGNSFVVSEYNGALIYICSE